MKIVCVCGLGMGSSLIMKMTIDKIVRELGVEAEVEHWDAGTVGSKEADLIVTTEDFTERFAGQKNVIFLRNCVSGAEAKEKLKAFFESK